MGQKYNKLVRDNIPEYLTSIGVPFEKRVAGEDEYREALHAKLEEEVNEFFKARTADELADVMEVVKALRHLPEYTEAKTIQRTKREDKGGFEERYIVKGEKPDEVKTPAWPILSRATERVSEARERASDTMEKYSQRFKLPHFFQFTTKKIIFSVILAVLMFGSVGYSAWKKSAAIPMVTCPPSGIVNTCVQSKASQIIESFVWYLGQHPEMFLLMLVISYIFMCFVFPKPKQK